MNTYTKLRSGGWGIKVDGTAVAGQVVIVTTKAGATRTETVAAVVHSGPAYSVCTIVPKPWRQPKRPGSRLSNGRCRECRGPVVDAPHCKAREGLCGSCAFDDE
jgi:hypothetical protein